VGSTAAGVLTVPERRVDGHDKVSGRMQYTADVKRPGMLWAAFTTSPHAFATIRRIDVNAAHAVPGVRAILTGDDIGRVRFGRNLHDWPVLAFDRVLMIGDRVAAVAAETREAAEEAARAVVVSYNEHKPVLDPMEALAPNAPIFHPDRGTYYHRAFEGKDPMSVPHPNVQGLRRFASGESDLELLFAAHRVFEHTYRTPRQHAGYIEPRSTLVWVDDDGTIHVQSPNKIPFWLRHSLSKCFDVPEERIVIEPSAIGGDFGGKGMTVDEAPCYFLAKATGRPVRHVETYADEMGYATTRHATTVTLKTAVDRDGRFIAHLSDVVFDGGAYAGGKVGAWLVPGFGYSGVPYYVPNYQVLSRSVYTNQLAGAHVRAPVDAQVFFAWEQHVDEIAGALGIDPLELRLRNLLRDGQKMMTGEVVREVNAARVVETLRREARCGEPLPPGRGRGIALTARHTPAFLGASIALRANADGRLDIVTGVTEQGSGQLTMLQRVAAATLEVRPERIRVRRANTAESPSDPGTGGSWVTNVQGRAMHAAATNLKALLEERSGMTLRDDAFASADGRRKAFEVVAATLCAEGPLEVVGSSAPVHGADVPCDFSFSAYAVEVLVDRETGAVDLLDVTLVCDSGAVINPIGHQGQIEGGFAMGLGSALLEEIAIDESGKVVTLSLGDYKLPTIADMPPLRTIVIRAKDAGGPFGAKMAGELSNTGVAPAIANAIANAVGVRLDRFPLTPERVWAALNA
jgi:CO/xanthine dehydrogenase Mo-binding subunit